MNSFVMISATDHIGFIDFFVSDPVACTLIFFRWPDLYGFLVILLVTFSY